MKYRAPDFVIIGSAIATGAILADWDLMPLAPAHYTLAICVGLLLTWLLIRARHAQLVEKWTLAILMCGAALALHIQAPGERGSMKFRDERAADLRKSDEASDHHEFPREIPPENL
jgi:hypothetical protein